MLGLTFALQVTPDGKTSVPTRQHIEAFAADRTRFVTEFRMRLTKEMEAGAEEMIASIIPGQVLLNEPGPNMTIRLRSAEPGDAPIPGYTPGPPILGFEDAEMRKWKINGSLQTTANCLISKIHADIRKLLVVADIKKIVLVRDIVREVGQIRVLIRGSLLRYCLTLHETIFGSRIYS